MTMKLKVAILVLIGLFAFPRTVSAIYDPATTANNQFGIHVADTSDLVGVSKLVNSNGGDWGYVTFVIQNGERNPKKWQDTFDQMRRLHLIPIVRIATAPIAGQNNIWAKPSVNEIDGWVSFLNSLNWVIQNRYVIIGNEPNHASEWGGEVDPSGYADYLKIFSEKLKKSNSDFFIMPAGMDASATNLKGSTMEESLYLSKMFEEDSRVFEFIDGWSSHSYANPNFSGEATSTGKGTVSTFDWELNYLKSLGFEKDLPVFITETGWIHNIDSLSTDLGPKFEYAFKNVWNDKRVIAVTPFIYKYIEPPFDTFSWVNKKGEFYDFYNTVLNLPKVNGAPLQVESSEIITGTMPKIAMANSLYHAVIFIKNTGQSIWKVNNLGIVNGKVNRFAIQSMYPASVEPNQIGVFLVDGVFPNSTGGFTESLFLTSNNKIISKPFIDTVTIIPKFPNLNEVLDYFKLVVLRRLGA